MCHSIELPHIACDKVIKYFIFSVVSSLFSINLLSKFFLFLPVKYMHVKMTNVLMETIGIIMAMTVRPDLLIPEKKNICIMRIIT